MDTKQTTVRIVTKAKGADGKEVERIRAINAWDFDSKVHKLAPGEKKPTKANLPDAPEG